MGSKVRKMLGVVLVVSMIVSCLTGFGKEEAKATLTPVPYLYYNDTNGRFEEKSCTIYEIITGSTTTFNGSKGESWYVAEGTVTVSDRITVTGTVNLILKDNCVFTAAKGINVASGNALTIYGQGTINGATGQLIAEGAPNQAGIGGGNGKSAGSITINGGKVRATGGKATRVREKDGAGIGGGGDGSGGTITINGGEVTARGLAGAGIGGGQYGDGGIIKISGGVVTANGVKGAGIGGGYRGDGGNITIAGGEVNATGETDPEWYEGAGIGGGGGDGSGGNITITGGKVTAKAHRRSAGIGGGVYGSGGNITITGGEVTATCVEQGPGIGFGIACSDHFVGTYNLASDICMFVSNNEENGYAEITGTGTFDNNNGKKYAIVYKEHSGIMTASGSAITAKYIDESGDKQSIDLTINAPSEIVYGNDDSAKATLDSADNFNNALGKTGDKEVSESQIEYYDENGQLRGDAPTAKGNYTAKITVDGVTAAVGYEITKGDPAITAPVATSPEYTGDAQNLITAGLSTGGTLKYSLSENGTFSADIPTATAAGTYTVFYMVEGDNDYKSSIKYSVSAGISKASLNLSLTQEGWEKGSTAPDPVLNGNKGGGSVTYAYKNKFDNDNAYVDNAVPTEPGEYVVRATVSETQNYFGRTATAEFTITEPEPDPDPNTTPAPVTVYQLSYYPEEPKPVEKKGDGRTTTTEVKNSDGTISEISVTKLADGSITRETVRDKDGKFVEYKYEYTRTKKNGTTVVQTFNEKADGSKKETSVTTTKSGTVSTKAKEVTADGTLISTEGKSYADGRTSLKEATTGTDGVTKVVTEKTDAAGNGVKAEYTSVIDDAEAKSDTKISLTAVEVIGTTFKLPAEIWVNEQYFVVTEIGMGALKNNKAVTKLTIGENVTRIGSSAFRNMTNLKSITINASSLESIGKNAFKGVGDKKRVTITIKGVTEEEFEKICKMIRKAGIGKKAVFVIG